MGYVYVGRSDDEPMARADVGDTVRIPHLGPPWIVVNDTLERVVAVRWPGRLLRVAPLPPINAEERAALASAAENLRAGAGYTRALAVEVLEELAPDALFGQNGDAVIRVLDAALDLEATDRDGPLGVLDPRAVRAFSAAWNRWMARVRSDRYKPCDYSWTLNHYGSPIGCGLSTLSSTVHDGARKRGGADAFVVDDDGDECLAPRWQAVLGNLLHTAMALGAPELTDDHEAEIMTAAWNASRFAT